MVQQNINLYEIFKILGIISAIVVGMYAVSAQRKKDKEKFALNENVDLKFKNMDTELSALKNTIEHNEVQNRREHDGLADFLKQINSKIDRLIDKLL